jgi:hypothetical protein
MPRQSLLERVTTEESPTPSGAPNRSSVRRALRLCYFVVCNTLLLLLALELGVRAYVSLRPASPDDPPRTASDVTYTLNPFFQSTMPPAPEISAGPFLAGWLIHPPEHAQTEGRKRILFLGGSTTASNYPLQVQRILDRGVPTTAYVLGWDFHCSLHSLFKFWTYVDEVEPDLVVVLEAVNDFYRGFTSPDTSLPQYRSDYSHSAGGLFAFWTPGQGREDKRPLFYARTSSRFAEYDASDDSLGGALAAARDGSALLHAMRGWFPAAETHFESGLGDDPAVILRSLPAFRRNMQNLALSAKAKGVRILFLTMPFTTEGHHSFLLPGNFFTNDGVHHLSEEEFRRGMASFNEAVLELDAQPDVSVLDLAARLSDPALFVDEVHLTASAQIAEARAVAEFIVKHSLLD